MSKQHTRKPIKVEAIQWTDNDQDIANFLCGSQGSRPHIMGHSIRGGTFKISLAKYEIYLERGDYLIKADGFFDVVNEMQFKEEYEEIKDEELTPEQEIFKEGLTKVMFDYIKSNLK